MQFLRAQSNKLQTKAFTFWLTDRNNRLNIEKNLLLGWFVGTRVKSLDLMFDLYQKSMLKLWCICCCAGVEALVSCGMMESLLKVINWYGVGHDHITVRIIAIFIYML